MGYLLYKNSLNKEKYNAFIIPAFGFGKKYEYSLNAEILNQDFSVICNQKTTATIILQIKENPSNMNTV